MNTIGLNYNIAGVGYIDTRYDDKSVHAVKSIAGKAFHADAVKSVCVYDMEGTVDLYLRKLDNGEFIREERL